MAASRSQYFNLPRDTVADASAETRDADMSSADDPRADAEAGDVAMAPAGAQPAPSDPSPDQAMVPAGIAPAPGGRGCPLHRYRPMGRADALSVRGASDDVEEPRAAQ